MKALVIRQPWADMILDGKKTLERRSWKTKFRGKFFIVSGGHRIGEAELVDCREMRPEDEEGACCEYLPGMYVFVLRRARRVELFRVRGRLGFFDLGATITGEAT